MNAPGLPDEAVTPGGGRAHPRLPLHRLVVGDVDVGGLYPGDGFALGERPPAGRDHLCAQCRGRPHGCQTNSAGATHDHNPLTFHGRHGDTSRIALPRTLRPSSAAAASAAFSHGPRQSIWTSSSPAVTSPTRNARSGPKPGPMAKASMRVSPPRRRACSKSIVVGSNDAMPTLCTEPPGSSSAYTSARVRPPTLSRAPYTSWEMGATPTTTSAAPRVDSPSPRSGLPTEATTCAPARAASCTAHAPDQPNVTTRVPAGGPEPSGAAARTTPDASNPGTAPGA